MSKILLIDVDGTLVDDQNRLPDSAVTAIRQARDNGHRVNLCTGRSKVEVYQNFWDIGLDGMIGGLSIVWGRGPLRAVHRTGTWVLPNQSQCPFYGV